MIIRTWKALTTHGLLPDYLAQVRSVALPHLNSCCGYLSGEFTTRELADGSIEVLVLTFWESVDALAAFAGENSSQSYMPAEIAATLQSYDTTSDHYVVAISDRGETS